jgi:polyisoprenoid-binding protein YceI
MRKMQLEFGFKMAPIKLLGLTLFLYSFSIHAQRIDLTSGAKVEFDAIGKPAMINIKGTGAKATGSLATAANSVSGEFSIVLKDFTTDMDLRDEHMREKYLEVGKPGFDKAILKIEKHESGPIPTKGSYNPQGLKGLLTLHGVTKEIPLECKLNIQDSNAKGTVNFKIKVQDFKIDIPSFAGITMADEVVVNVFIDNKVLP